MTSTRWPSAVVVMKGGPLPAFSMMRVLIVVLPWSMCEIMQKLRILAGGNLDRSGAPRAAASSAATLDAQI
jgi:hypothetical protein